VKHCLFCRPGGNREIVQSLTRSLMNVFLSSPLCCGVCVLVHDQNCPREDFWEIPFVCLSKQMSKLLLGGRAVPVVILGPEILQFAYASRINWYAAHFLQLHKLLLVFHQFVVIVPCTRPEFVNVTQFSLYLGIWILQCFLLPSQVPVLPSSAVDRIWEV
jgi:hypothetical protein